MANTKQTNADNGQEHTTNQWLFCIQIGFFAGLIWGSIRWICYQIKFTTELPSFVADPFFQSAFLKSWWGILVGLASYIILSIIAAVLYKVIVGRLRGPWPGIGYGLVWWILIFVIAGPLLGITENITKAGWNTFWTELCIFLLWGVFIGYSIVFEFTDEATREPIKAG